MAQFEDAYADFSITANSTAGGALTDLVGASSAIVQLVGAFTATIQIQITRDGINWINITGSNSIINAATSAYMASGNLTAAGIYQVDVAGAFGVRVITTAYTSGTVAGRIAASSGAGVVSIEGLPLIAQSGTWTVQPGNTPNTTPWLANPGNPTNFSLLAAATTNATSVKATAGNVHGISITNYSAAPKFVKLYDKATAPTVGTDTPTDTFEIAANSSRFLEFGTLGLRFATGIALAITGAQPIADATALAVGDASVHMAYV